MRRSLNPEKKSQHFLKPHFFVDFRQVLCTSWLFVCLSVQCKGGLQNLDLHGLQGPTPTGPLFSSTAPLTSALQPPCALVLVCSEWGTFPSPSFCICHSIFLEALLKNVLPHFLQTSAQMSLHGGHPWPLCLICNIGFSLPLPLHCAQSFLCISVGLLPLPRSCVSFTKVGAWLCSLVSE